MTVDELAAVAERAVELAECDAEALVTVQRQALLRFADGQPIQHTTMTVPKVQLRLRDAGRLGEAEAEQFDDAALRDAVTKARRQMARLPAEPDLLPSVGPQPQLAVDAWDDASGVDSFGPEQRSTAAAAMAAPAREAGLAAAGISQTRERRVAMATANGMRGRYRATEVELSVTVQNGEASGSRRALSHAAGTIDPARMGAEATDVAQRAASPVPLEPGEYRVVLAPRAVDALVHHFLASGFNARGVIEGRSFIELPLGQPLGGDNITVRQDICHPLNQNLPFDFDGVGLRHVTLLDGGVTRQLLHDRRTAAELDAEPTGFSAGGRLRQGATVSGLVMDGGEASEEELIEACGDGLYISRLWYCNWVDPKACVVTGMTRDGLFRIRGGKLAEPVTNGRFNQDLPELLRSVLALGRPVRAESAVVPPLLADGFRLSSASSF